jgi:hypothetical protein
VAKPSPEATEGVVSYRLARERQVNAFKEGLKSRAEVCDAQPELRRVAHHHGVALGDECPICEGQELVLVTFAFGPGLPNGGRVISQLRDVRGLRARGKPSDCYRIEVCQNCWWNHLMESFSVDGGQPATSTG